VTLRPSSRAPQHDHLVLVQAERRLIFSDPRLFGRVRFDAGSEVPEWWRRLPPELLSDAFRRELVADFLRRRGRSPIKAVLLMQDRFPGIGNWMADEILFRAAIHPRRPAGTLQPAEIEVLWREIRTVARIALRSLSAGERDLPRHWLFHRRWDDGGTCPRTGVTLVRETIGGRTTCWSPGRQPSTALRSGRSVSRQRVRKRRTSS
jgi:formamidopyrimidine-DNA glycosylase